MSVTDVIAAACLLAGVLLGLLATIGLHRFHDVFARMHAATKPATLGLMLVIAGTSLRMDEPDAVAKLLLVVALQLLTAPAGAHMVGRAAYRSGVPLAPETVVDELAPHVPERADRSRDEP